MNSAELIPRVPCGICGTPTTMTATKRCERCWELEHRIESAPELAREILKAIDGRNEESV